MKSHVFSKECSKCGKQTRFYGIVKKKIGEMEKGYNEADYPWTRQKYTVNLYQRKIICMECK